MAVEVEVPVLCVRECTTPAAPTATHSYMVGVVLIATAIGFHELFMYKHVHCESADTDATNLTAWTTQPHPGTTTLCQPCTFLPTAP